MRKSIMSLLLALLAGAAAFSSDNLPGKEGWIISSDIRPEEPYFGITSANGTLGMVSSREPFQCSTVVLADTYDTFGRGRVSNFLPQVNPLALEIQIDGSKITAGKSTLYKQGMDLSDGSFYGDLTFRGHEVHYSFRALRNLPNAALLIVSITAGKACTLRIDNIHSLPSSQRDANLYFRTLSFHHKEGTKIDLMTTSSLSPTGRTRSVAASAFLMDGAAPEHIPSGEGHISRLTCSLEEGQTLSFCVVGSLISSAQVADPLNQAERIVTRACVEGQEELLRGHCEAWASLWKKGDIIIGGDPKVQLEVRSMLYHIYAFTREYSSFSPSPMGLSGLGYNGHVFWDSEIFMLPSLLVLNPELAKSMLQYRFDRLEQARRNASSWGFKGAMFPWESAETGAEECPVTALAGTLQHHITADVAIAAWNYYRVTRDKEWLRDTGWPLIEDCAKFWVSRVEEQDGEYHIRGVMGADEWAVYVDDDAYTNGAARRCLEYAAEAARVLGFKAPDKWKTIAGKLHFELFSDGVTREHSRYKGEEIKQADAVLLYWPLGLTDNAQALKDMCYYGKRVPKKGTPAMSKFIHSIICARAGNSEEALKWFIDSYRPNAKPPFGVLAEFEGGTNPYFLTGAGGTLQALIYGFGGYDITDKGLVKGKTNLPPGWTSLTIKGQ